MISVGVRELREHVGELLQRVREQGEIIEITYHGEAVARIVPVKPTPITPDEMSAIWSSIDQLAAEIGAHWPKGVSAADAVADDRREL